MISRRSFLTAVGSGAVTLAFLGLRRYWNGAADSRPWTGYGDLVPDSQRILDLPPQFRYQMISNTGDRMDDGMPVPAGHDGMAAFSGGSGRTVIVRNHELSAAALETPAIDARLVYDPMGGRGGTTTLLYDTRRQRLERHFRSLIGTVRNCGGGKTPWNTWISCEESTQRMDDRYAADHGFNFEVPAAARGLVAAVPLKAMGRFNHEAVAVDVATGIVYQTEDRSDSLFYRFIPAQPGQLERGGRLQALKINDMPGADTSNQHTPAIPIGTRMAVNWVELHDVESANDDLRSQGVAAGAARFVRGEGMWADRGSIYFASTGGGATKCGQIWRYIPGAGKLELFAEPGDAAVLKNPDNIAVAPWGDLLVCEDRSGENHVVGITPQGRYYTLARNVLNDSEFAGSVFSPDGTTLFVNIQNPGLTLAITGPWRDRTGLG